MTHDESVNILKNYQLWRRGKPPYDFGQPVEMPFTPEELGQALEIADEQWRLQLANLRLQIYKLESEELRLSHMVDSLMDILSELVELRHIKTTQGKTPEYLERQLKAWARAEEAVK